MYAHWIRAFHHANATPSPSEATGFYDRALPGFQSRIGDWLGPHPEQCQAGTHDSQWDQDVSERVRQVRLAARKTLQALDGQFAVLLSSTRSAPPEADLDAS